LCAIPDELSISLAELYTVPRIAFWPPSKYPELANGEEEVNKIYRLLNSASHWEDVESSQFHPPDYFHRGWGMEATGMGKINEITAYQNLIMPTKSPPLGDDAGDTYTISTIAQKNTSLFDPWKNIWLVLSSLLPNLGSRKGRLGISKSCTSRLRISATT
jgi:hypothetical protein